MFIVFLREGEFGFADDFLPGIEDVVVIGRRVIITCPVGVTDQHVDMRGGLPNIGDFYGEIIDPVLSPKVVVEPHDCVCALGVHFETVGMEYDCAVVSGRPPDNLGMVVPLSYWHTIKPLSLKGLVGCHLAQLNIVGVVGQEESVVPCCPSLHHAE